MTKSTSLLIACLSGLSAVSAYGCAGDASDADITSTDEAFSAGAEITLYEDDNFQGRTLTLRSETDNFADIGFNDLTSSVIVRRGSWTLCTDAFFGGRCNTFTQGQYANLYNLGAYDQYSSARPNGGFGGGPTGLAWSSAGPIGGKFCIQINEPADPDTWNDNYLCMDRDVGLRWSYAGQIGGMFCLSMNESAEPPEHTWADNYLCSPRDMGLRWSTAGAIGGMRCTQIAEPADPDTWMDNYLCQP